MALILHISDLHLVTPSASVPAADHKVGLVAGKDRLTHHLVLTTTLRRLSEELVSRGRTLDAIVMTGDISDKNNEGGYLAFEELLEALSSVRPTKRHILVLPGNHDVASGLRPGDPRRYHKFLKYIREAGYVTPWLAGVDKAPTSKSEAEGYIVALDDIQIIPIDTSGFSQVRLDVGISDASWARLEEVVTGSPQEEAALQRLRLADAARVSEDELEAVRTILKLATDSTAMPLRIAATHHHLLPVSMREEVKPFESMTNLGLVRQFLREQGIAIVLHGHKHAESTYVDFVSPYRPLSGTPSRIRVISGAAATEKHLDRTDAFRLLDIQPTTGLLKLHKISVIAPGMEVLIGNPELLDFVQPGRAQVLQTGRCTLVEGNCVGDVYRRLVATVASQGPESEHVMCRVADSPKIEQIAALYPGLARAQGSAEWTPVKRLEQFQNIVQWWQYTSVPRGPLDHPAFTHGDRIRRYEGHLDQLEGVVEAFANDAATSRGIVVLLNPPADKIAERVQFPSFCLIQFKIQHNAGETTTLDCTAYFRKQEVRYWWLVNLAELVELQRSICDALRQRTDIQQKIKGIRPGAITTIAVRAHAGDSAPKVQIPLVDRCYSLERERLFGMVNSLVWDGMPNREEYAAEWLQMFQELHPPEKPDPDGVAVAQVGIQYLKDEIEKHVKPFSAADEPLAELHRTLERLLNANQGFALAQQKEEATSERYESWRAIVRPQIERIIELSYGRITANSAR